MELQRVLAKDTRSAMKEIQTLYGDDALVVSNNKSRGRTEIIVAIDLASYSDEESRDLHYGAQHKINILKSATEQSFNDVMEEKIFNSPPISPPVPLITPKNVLLEDSHSKQPEIEQQLDYVRSRELLELVKRELASIREEVRISQRLIRNDALTNLNEQSKQIIEGLNVTAMPLPMRVLVSDMIAKHRDPETLIKVLSKTIGTSIKDTDLLSSPSGIHIIAGPVGAGKTTMASRIARQKALDNGGENVAVISFNDGRVGAWDQSQLLGLQTGVNTFSAQTSDMLAHIIEHLRSRELIIIDTAGTGLEAQLPLLQTALPDAKAHLLLPADASQALTNQYLNMPCQPWASMMLSHLEDGVFPWSVSNSLMNIDTPLSIASNNSSAMEAAQTITGCALALHGFQQLGGGFN